MIYRNAGESGVFLHLMTDLLLNVTVYIFLSLMPFHVITCNITSIIRVQINKAYKNINKFSKLLYRLGVHSSLQILCKTLTVHVCTVC